VYRPVQERKETTTGRHYEGERPMNTQPLNSFYSLGAITVKVNHSKDLIKDAVDSWLSVDNFAPLRFV